MKDGFESKARTQHKWDILPHEVGWSSWEWREASLSFPRWTPTLGVGTPKESMVFKRQFEGPNWPLESKSSELLLDVTNIK